MTEQSADSGLGAGVIIAAIFFIGAVIIMGITIKRRMGSPKGSKQIMVEEKESAPGSLNNTKDQEGTIELMISKPPVDVTPGPMIPKTMTLSEVAGIPTTSAVEDAEATKE